MTNELMQMAVQSFKGKDPKQMVMSIVQNNNNLDPRITQMVSFAQAGDMNSLVNLATSMFEQNGMNLNDVFTSFMSMMK